MRTRGMSLAGLLLATMTLAGCGSTGDDGAAAAPSSAAATTSAAPETFTLLGSVVISDMDSIQGATGTSDQEHCEGAGKLDGVAENSTVTVSDAAGKIVGAGELGTGTGRLAVVSMGASRWFECALAVSVPDVQEGSDVYQVKVGAAPLFTLTADEATAGAFRHTLD